MNASNLGVRLAGFVFVGISCAHADIITSMAELEANPRAAAYFKSPSTTEAIAQMALAKERKFGMQPECGAHEAKFVTMDVLSPIEFPAEQEHPTKGRWQAIIELHRCGQRRAYSAIIGAIDREAPKPKFVSAGLSLANERLIIDAVGSALLAVVLRDPETSKCKDIEFFNLAVTEPPTLSRSRTGLTAGKWKENWTFWVCGKLHTVEMRFEPDKNGNGIRFFVDAGTLAKQP
jgi:hypothetical protein